MNSLLYLYPITIYSHPVVKVVPFILKSQWLFFSLKNNTCVKPASPLPIEHTYMLTRCPAAPAHLEAAPWPSLFICLQGFSSQSSHPLPHLLQHLVQSSPHEPSPSHFTYSFNTEQHPASLRRTFTSTRISYFLPCSLFLFSG